MEDGAALLAERVLPDVPYRQWVMSFPRRLRLALALDSALTTRVLAITLRAIFAWQRRRARRLGWRLTRTAAVTFIQRFSSALRLHVHFHCLPTASLRPSRSQAEHHPSSACRRLATARKTLLLLRPIDPSDLGLEADALEQIYTAALPPPRRGFHPPVHRPRCSSIEGFSLHADVHVAAGDRSGLERICRYGLRPPFASERLERLPSGDLAYRMKRTSPDGATHRVMSPLEFLAALSSLVPPPRVHLTRYHGLFAPHARDRRTVRAAAPALVTVAPDRPALDSPSADLAPPTPLPSGSCDLSPARSAYRRTWAELLKKVFAIDVFLCDRCGARRRIVAAITQPDVAQAILCCIGVAHPREPARVPPHAVGPERSGDPRSTA